MRWFLVVCAAAAALASGVCANCDACLYGRCYRTHVLPAETKGSIGDIDRNTNTLYVTSHPYEDRIRQCNLDTLACNEYDVEDIRKIVVDQRTGDIYGNSFWREAIYRFDLNKNEQQLIAPNVQTWDIHFKDKLYYAVSYSGIYTYENGLSRIVPGTEGYDVVSIVVDKNNDIYFNQLLSFQPRISRVSAGVIYDDDFLDTISVVTTDKDGNVMFINNTYPNPLPIASTRVYRKINGQVVEVGAINDWTNGEPLFDRDNNLVYSNSSIGPLVYLKKENVKCGLENNTIIAKTDYNIEDEEFTYSGTDESDGSRNSAFSIVSDNIFKRSALIAGHNIAALLMVLCI